MKYFLLLLLFVCLPVGAQADTLPSVLQQQMEQYDFSLLPATPQNPFAYDIQKGVRSMAAGEFAWDVHSIIRSALDFFFKQMRQNAGLMIGLVVFALFSSLVLQLQDSFGGDGTGKGVFYACFAIITTMGLTVFHASAEAVKSTMEQMLLLINTLAPTLLTLMATSGYAVTATSIYPVLLAATSMVTTLVNALFTPLIFLSTALGIANLLTDDLPMKRMANLCVTVIKWGIGVVLTVFLGVIGVFGAVIPAFDSVTIKTARYAVGSFIPVVGTMLSDSVDLVVNSSLVLKNAVGLSGMLGLLALCAVPLLRLMAQAALLHIGAAVVEPIAHPRMTELIATLGRSVTLLFAMLLTVTMMFVIAIGMVIGAGGSG